MEPRRPGTYGARRGKKAMWSKIKALLAAALIIAGIATFTYEGIATRRRSFNPLPTSRIPLTVIVGAISLVAGIALLLMDTQDFKRAATRKRAQNGELR